MTAISKLPQLLELLESELQSDASMRESHATDESLEWAIAMLRESESRLTRLDVRGAQGCVDSVARVALDSWSLFAPVTSRLAECAQQMRQLLR